MSRGKPVIAASRAGPSTTPACGPVPAGGGRAEDLETSIAIAREVGDRWGLAIGLAAAGTALNDAGRTTAAAPVFEEALAVCDELGERYIANTVRYKLAAAQFRLGRTAEGEAMLRGVIAHARGTRDLFSLAMALADLGLARALQGDIDGGIAMLAGGCRVVAAEPSALAEPRAPGVRDPRQPALHGGPVRGSPRPARDRGEPRAARSARWPTASSRSP